MVTSFLGWTPIAPVYRAGPTHARHKKPGKPMRYFANIGNAKGSVKYRDVIGAIGVLESRDNHMPIGMAFCKTWDENGLAVWVLTIGGREIPGRWVIIDREFKPIASAHTITS
jgi:hypothetical protein